VHPLGAPPIRRESLVKVPIFHTGKAPGVSNNRFHPLKRKIPLLDEKLLERATYEQSRWTAIIFGVSKGILQAGDL
jgi:hypothetical protein